MSSGSWKLQQALTVGSHRCNSFLNPLHAAVNNPATLSPRHSFHGVQHKASLRESPAFMCAGALRACRGPGTSRVRRWPQAGNQEALNNRSN